MYDHIRLQNPDVLCLICTVRAHIFLRVRSPGLSGHVMSELSVVYGLGSYVMI